MRIVTLTLTLGLLVSACSSNVQNLEVGDCFDDWENLELDVVQEVESVPVVDCADPHDNEMYLVEHLPQGPFPGDDAMEQMAVDSCLGAFDGFVGTPYADSRLDFGFLVSTSEMWDADIRRISCFVWDIEFLKLTGTMRNAQI
jgi:hypothetical protein